MNAHLAALDEMYEKRNADFYDLSKRLIFDSGIPVDADAASQWGSATIRMSVYETDVLFWMVRPTSSSVFGGRLGIIRDVVPSRHIGRDSFVLTTLSDAAWAVIIVLQGGQYSFIEQIGRDFGR